MILLVVVYTPVSLLTCYIISNHETYQEKLNVEAMVERLFGRNKDEAKEPEKVRDSVEEMMRQRAADIQALQHWSFPLHVGSGVEEIAHPGLFLAKQSDEGVSRENKTDTKTGMRLMLPRTLQVPKFFDDSHGHVYGGSIREYLGGGGRLPTPEEAHAVGSFDREGRETIYASVASYRDYECRHTVEDLYDRARYPERIRVAIIDQIVDGDDKCNAPIEACDANPGQALCRYAHLIDYRQMDARLAVGPVFARHLAHRHYRGEYYAMQVDSHVRFVQDWDEDLIGQWKSARNEMAILTTYLSDLADSIDPVTHRSQHPDRPIMCASDYEGEGGYRHLRHGQQPEGIPYIKGEPTLQPFWAAGFSFARGHFVIQVPYDQFLPMVFQGEEISIGLRAFTYGYDFYAPERGVCFHMYASEENKEDRRNKVPLFWENQARYKGVELAAMKRLNMIIGMAHHGDSEWQHDDMYKYGLGEIRRTDKFFRTFGIHTETKTVEKHLCRFVGHPMMKVFHPALRENGMGLDYDKIDYEYKDATPNQE
jgi:hypothetical protein